MLSRSKDEFGSISLDNLDLSHKEIKKKPHILDQMPIDEAAKIAVSLVGPRVYKLTGFENDKLKFFLIGCSGNGKKSQKDVARLMDKIASLPESCPAFIILAGDLLYPAGASTPTDPVFQQNFFDIYFDEKLKTLRTLPFFACLGNHEEHRYKGHQLGLNYTRPEGGIKAALNVVAATYVPDSTKFHSISELVDFFQQEEIDINKLQAFNMPFYYYALQAGDIQLTFANSNSLAKSFLEYRKTQRQEGCKKLYDEENFQVPWLKKTYENFKDKFHVHVMHNPRHPLGKRAVKPDTGLYLNPKQQCALNQALNTKAKYYHEFMNSILDALGIQSELHLSAHEHLNNYINTQPISERNAQTQPHSKIRQVGAGGGGGDLQRQEDFNYKNVGTVLSNNGLWEITIDMKNPKDAELKLYTIPHDLQEEEEIEPNHYLVFNLQSHTPIRTPSEDKRIETVRNILLQACHNVFALKEQQRLQQDLTSNQDYAYEYQKNKNGFFTRWYHKVSKLTEDAMNYAFPKYKPNDVDFLHDLMADLNQPLLPDLNGVLDYYHNTLSKLTDKSLVIDAVKNQIKVLKDTNKDFADDYYQDLLAPPAADGPKHVYF